MSLIGIYFAATSMLRTLRVAFRCVPSSLTFLPTLSARRKLTFLPRLVFDPRSTLFVAKYGSVLALVAIIYQAFTSSDPAKSLQSSLSTIVHSASALGGLGGSALYWLSMFVGGETGENVRKLASYVFSTSAEEKKSRGGGPASRTRSSKKANNKKKPSSPLAGLFNSAPDANNGDASNGGGDVVQDFLAKVVGGAGGETVDQLKTLLSGGGNLQDMLGALAGAVGGQNEGGR